MAEFDRPSVGLRAGSTGAVIDEGLRSYMLRVYNYMTGGLVITGLVAYFANMMAVASDSASAVAQAPNGALLTQFGVLLYTSPADVGLRPGPARLRAGA